MALRPIETQETSQSSLAEGLDSKDWVKVCKSLNDARRLSLYHSTLLLPILEKVMLVVVKAMKNPRSALCKTSIMAASDIFNAFGEKLLASTDSSAFDQLLLQLLLKASQDKKFVFQEADRSLTEMVKSITPLPLLQKLRGYVNHGNLRVRAKAAVSVSNSVFQMVNYRENSMEQTFIKCFEHYLSRWTLSCLPIAGAGRNQRVGLVTLLQMAADLLNDRLPEAREAARRTVFSIYKASTENEEQNSEEAWQSFCHTSLPPIHAQQHRW
ncbi:hypothetical protein CRYUN_Cryun18bG0015300 [Craigia yunnanensis]